MNGDCNLIFSTSILTGLESGRVSRQYYFDSKICGLDRLEVNGGQREETIGKR